MSEITYCSFEGRPTLYVPGEAWWLVNGEWKEANSAEVSMGAAVLTKAEFIGRFGQPKDLPVTAFQDGDSLTDL